MLNSPFQGETPEKSTPQRKSRFLAILIASLILFFVFIFSAGLFAYTRFMSPERQAYQRCQKEISDIVYSPETAQFGPFAPETVRKPDAVHFVVNIPVKAANKFGTLTNSKFTCYLLHSGRQWSVERIESQWDVKGIQE